jgi:predicted nucleic acid-binding protein
MLDHLLPTPRLAGRAFALAARHGFSAYDGLYLAAAEHASTWVVTADERLFRRAGEVGLGSLVRLLAS